MDRTLRAALLKLHGQPYLQASQFTAAQRRAVMFTVSAIRDYSIPI